MFPGSLTRLYGVQNTTASISLRANNAITTQYLVKDVPPTSGGILHAICSFLWSCSNVMWIWWQLTHHILVHIIRLSLKDSCLEINVRIVPSFAACHLATHPKSGPLWKQGKPSADIPSVFLGNLSVPFWPLPLKKIPLMIRLDGEHPSSCHTNSRLNLLHVDEIKNIVVNLGFVLKVFCFSELFVVSSYFLS